MIENQRFTSKAAKDGVYGRCSYSLSYRGKAWLMIIAGYAVSGVLLYWALHGFS